jgi:hypothetical protein
LCLNQVSKEWGRKRRSDPKIRKAQNEAQRQRRKTEEGKFAERQAQLKYRQTIHGRAVRMWIGAKKRAEQSQLPFTITPELVENQLQFADELWRSKGLPFEFTGKKRAYTPSLDQIVAGAGYTPKNVRVVHLAWNTFKGDFFTDIEAAEFSEKISRVLGTEGHTKEAEFVVASITSLGDKDEVLLSSDKSSNLTTKWVLNKTHNLQVGEKVIVGRW